MDADQVQLVEVDGGLSVDAGVSRPERELSGLRSISHWCSKSVWSAKARPRCHRDHPNGKTAYVTITGGPCYCWNTSLDQYHHQKPGKVIKVRGLPGPIAISPSGTTAYVASSPGGTARATVTPINTATNSPGKPIKVGIGPGTSRSRHGNPAAGPRPAVADRGHDLRGHYVMKLTGHAARRLAAAASACTAIVLPAAALAPAAALTDPGVTERRPLLPSLVVHGGDWWWLPGVRYRRHVLWRYSLVWTKPVP